MFFKVYPTKRTSFVHFEPIFSAVAMKNVPTGETFDAFIWIITERPWQNPSMHTEHFCLDFPIFIVLISLMYLLGRALALEKVLLFYISKDNL